MICSPFLKITQYLPFGVISSSISCTRKGIKFKIQHRYDSEINPCLSPFKESLPFYIPLQKLSSATFIHGNTTTLKRLRRSLAIPEIFVSPFVDCHEVDRIFCLIHFNPYMPNSALFSQQYNVHAVVQV